MKFFLKITVISLLTICGTCMAAGEDQPNELDPENNFTTQLYSSALKAIKIGSEIAKQGFNLVYEDREDLIFITTIAGLTSYLTKSIDTIENDSIILDEATSPCAVLLFISLLDTTLDT